MAAAQTPLPRSQQRPKHHPPQPIHRPVSLCCHCRRIRGASTFSSTSNYRRTDAAPAFAAVDASTATATPPGALCSAIYPFSIVYQPADAGKGAEGRPIVHKHRRNQPTWPARPIIASSIHAGASARPTFLRNPAFLRCIVCYYPALPHADSDGEGYNATICKLKWCKSTRNGLFLEPTTPINNGEAKINNNKLFAGCTDRKTHDNQSERGRTPN